MSKFEGLYKLWYTPDKVLLSKVYQKEKIPESGL